MSLAPPSVSRSRTTIFPTIEMDRIELLPLVKAYPALSKTYGEVCCVAGIQMTSDGPRWIRLYPIPFRALADRQQFRKYQRIGVRVETHSGDRRPETRRPDRDSIELVGAPIPTSDGWARRRRWVEPLMTSSMCELRRQRKRDGTSLGVFRPGKVEDLVIEEVDLSAEKKAIAKAWAGQGSLLDGLDGEEKRRQLREIEQIPYRFKYRYRCDEAGCKGHEQSIIDWEIVQFYRQVRNSRNWEQKLRTKWLGELCASDRDTAFIAGNQHQHPTSFMILGVWWPPKRQEQLALGQLGNV
jgi:hypothetical protein